MKSILLCIQNADHERSTFLTQSFGSGLAGFLSPQATIRAKLHSNAARSIRFFVTGTPQQTSGKEWA